MNTAALGAVSQTRALAGRRVRLYDERWSSLFSVALLAAAGSFAVYGFAVGAAALVAVLVPMQLYVRTNARIAKRHDDAVAALNAGDLERAEREFAALLSQRLVARALAVTALHNLTHLALARGEPADAALLARATLATIGSRTSWGPYGTVDAALRATCALALAVDGAVDDAEAIATAPLDADAGANSAARTAIARAYVAFVRGRHDAVLALLEQHRRLFRNVCSGTDAALVVALESAARQRGGGAYRASDAALALDFDESARAFVARMLAVAH